jgi:hypothetical protein
LGLARAGGSNDDWQFLARIYGWFPSIDGDLKYALPGGQDSATVDAGDIIDALQMTFMGSFMARKGDWSFATDLIYLKLANDKDNAISVPGGFGPGVNVNVDQEIKGWVWGLAGAYTVYRTERANLDVLVGLRMLDIEVDADLKVDGPLPPTLPGRRLSQSETLWDGIVGLKSRVAFDDRWFAPYYLDVGTGDSSLTWQAMTGVGYGFGWGDVTLTYRHLYYDQSSDKLLQNFSFSGPAVGVNVRF